MKSRIYDVVKYTTTVAIPALSAAYVGLDVALNDALPYENEVAKAVVVITTLLGALVLQQSVSYNRSEERFDGELEVNAHDPSLVHSLNLDGIEPRKLGTSKEVILKIVKNNAVPPDPDLD